MANSSSVKVNYLLNMSYQMLKLVTPLLSTPYLSRILTVDGVGYYSYTYSVANMFYLLALLGMENYGVRLIASKGADRKGRTESFWSAYAAQLTIGLIVVCLYLVFTGCFNKEYYPIDMIWALWIASAAIDISWLFFGMQDFRTPTFRSTVIKIVTLVSLFIFVRSEGDLWKYVLLTAGGLFIEQASLWPFASKYVDGYRPRFCEIFRHVKPNIMLFVPVIAINCYTTLDKVILGFLSSIDQVGYFEYSEKMSRMPLTLITALGTVSLPKLSGVWKSGNQEYAFAFMDKSIWITFWTSCAFMFGIIAVSSEFVPVFFGEGYEPCRDLMSVLSLMIPAISITNVIGTQFLLPNNLDSVYALSVAIAALFNIALNFLLIPDFGAMGCAIAMVVTEYVVLSVQLVAIRGRVPVVIFLKKAAFALPVGVIMFCAIRVFSGTSFAAWVNPIVGLFMECLGGASIYLALAVAVNWKTGNKHFLDFVSRLKQLAMGAK